MTRIGLAISLALILVAATRWSAIAQQQGPRFTGQSDNLDAKDLSVARRSFEPGARSAWHSHEKGQLIYVEQGHARVQRKGESVRELKPGDSDYTGPNVVHWHGAVPNERFIQVNVGFGGGSKWFEDVTDAEYNAKRD